jgi:hypothetical protein
MTPEQILEAERLVEEWKKHNVKPQRRFYAPAALPTLDTVNNDSYACSVTKLTSPCGQSCAESLSKACGMSRGDISNYTGLLPHFTAPVALVFSAPGTPVRQLPPISAFPI